MKQGTVKFSKEFVTPIGLHEWITLEWPVDESFDEKRAMETFTKVKDFVCNYQSWPTYDPIYSTTPPPTSAPVIQVKPEDREIGVIVEHIMSCDDLKTLDTYKFLVKGKGKEHLQDAFNTRENQIIQRMTKE